MAEIHSESLSSVERFRYLSAQAMVYARPEILGWWRPSTRQQALGNFGRFRIKAYSVTIGCSSKDPVLLPNGRMRQFDHAGRLDEGSSYKITSAQFPSSLRMADSGSKFREDAVQRLNEGLR